MHPGNSNLIHAFSVTLRADALVALSVFPECPRQSKSFSVKAADEAIVLPCRIYHNPSLIDTAPLTTLQRELVDCLLTRHIDGLRSPRTFDANHWFQPCLDLAFRRPACRRVRD